MCLEEMAKMISKMIIWLQRSSHAPPFIFLISDILTPYAYAPPWTPLNPGFYSISGGCRNSYLFYTTVHHGK